MIPTPEEYLPFTKPCCSCAVPTWWRAADTGNPICTDCTIKQGRNAVNAVPPEVRRAVALAEERAAPAAPPSIPASPAQEGLGDLQAAAPQAALCWICGREKYNPSFPVDTTKYCWRYLLKGGGSIFRDDLCKEQPAAGPPASPVPVPSGSAEERAPRCIGTWHVNPTQGAVRCEWPAWHAGSCSWDAVRLGFLGAIAEAAGSAESAAYARGLERGAQKLDDSAAFRERAAHKSHGAGCICPECHHTNLLRAAASDLRYEARALAGTGAQPPSDDARVVLAELLRLYDWRFELAERQEDPHNNEPGDFRDETRRLLRQYGTEKKAAWEAARRALAGAEEPTPAEQKKPEPPPAPPPRPQVVIGEASDGWHVALATYPASMDTACGKKMLPATQFETTDAARGHTFCIACLNAWPEPAAAAEIPR